MGEGAGARKAVQGRGVGGRGKEGCWQVSGETPQARLMKHTGQRP